MAPPERRKREKALRRRIYIHTGSVNDSDEMNRSAESEPYFHFSGRGVDKPNQTRIYHV